MPRKPLRNPALASVCALAALALGACDEPSPSEAARPNILLIMADDLGYETLSVNGGTSYRTPNLDQLAAAGMRFTAAHATPLCTPSRVQVMTGKYNFRNYVGFGILDPGERTFGHLLGDAGYATGVFGKWQLWGNEGQRRLAGGRGGSLPHEAGFDEHALWQITELGSRYKDPLLDASGEGVREYPGGYGPDIVVDRIEGFIVRHRDRPFFVYYPMILPHNPFQPTPDNDDYAESDPGTRGSPERFGDSVAYMDKLVGRLVARLDELGLRDDTLVLFVGDNGTNRRVTSMLGDQPIRGNKGYTTNAGTHVPMIASWPGVIEPGQVNDNLVDLTDFLPTLLEAAAVELPEDFVTDGLSFYPQLTGDDAPAREWIFCHYAPAWNNLPHRRFVFDHAFKLYDDGSFYRLERDPDEQVPLAEGDLDADALEVKRRFEAVLERMR